MDTDDLKNRFVFHPAPDAEKRAQHGSIRDACLQLALHLHWAIPEGREKELAVTNLEQVMFWGNAALARPHK